MVLSQPITFDCSMMMMIIFYPSYLRVFANDRYLQYCFLCAKHCKRPHKNFGYQGSVRRAIRIEKWERGTFPRFRLI